MDDWDQLDDDLLVKRKRASSSAPGHEDEDLIFMGEVLRETPSFRVPLGPRPNPPAAPQPQPQLTLLDQPIEVDLEDEIDWDIEIDEDIPLPSRDTFDGEDDDVMTVKPERFRHTSEEYMPEERDVATPMRFSRAPSHFDGFPNFKPQHHTPFEEEFSRLASSQCWTPGTREWTRERSIAVDAELRTHYFSPFILEAGPAKRESITPQPSRRWRAYYDLDDPKNNPAASRAPDDHPMDGELRLYGFQDLCREVGIDPAPHTIYACQRRLQGTLINIVDLVDARRTGKAVKIWTDFDDFCRYTFQPGKMFSCSLAMEDGILESLLRRVRPPPGAPTRCRPQGVAGSGMGRTSDREDDENKQGPREGRIVKRVATRPIKPNPFLLAYDYDDK